MTAPTASDIGETVLPRSVWLGVLRETTVEVFSIMVGAAIVIPETDDCQVVPYLTAVIGITGVLKATFTLRCSDQSATKVAAQMLGVSKDEAAAQKCDAIGEVCNMVAGHFKLKIGHGGTSELTVPSVIIGGNYRIHSESPEERLEFPMMYEGEPVWLALDICK
jgi:chemotaxis protein CheX